MPRTVINDGDDGLTVRTALNDMTLELYNAVAADPYPRSLNHAALPVASGSNAIRIVENTTGSLLLGTRKLAGLWWDNPGASVWERLGPYERSAQEIINTPGAGSSATTVQGAIDDIGARTTDGWTEGATNKYFTENRVLATVLTGLSVVTNAAVAATDTVLVGIGKLQAQVSALVTSVAGKENTGVAAGLIAAHTGAGDPHPQYLTPVEGDAAYASAAHGHASGAISDFTEAVQDVVGGMAAASGGTYDDTLGTVTWPGGAEDFVEIGLAPTSYWQAAGASTTITNVGDVALTAVATVTAQAAIASTNAYTSSRLVEYLATVASTTNIAGFRHPAAKWFISNNATRGGFKAVCRFAPATGVGVATSRCFVGFRPAAAPTDVEPSTILNMVGVGWDAADANIQIMHNDGAGTATKIDLGAGFPVPTADRTKRYELRLSNDPNTTSVNYTFLDRDNPGAAISGNLNTNTPTVNTTLGFAGTLSVGGTSSVVGMALGTLVIQG